MNRLHRLRRGLAVAVWVLASLVPVVGFGAAAAGGSWRVFAPAQTMFFDPKLVAIGPDATVYVFNEGTNTIQRIPPSGPLPAPWALPARDERISGIAVDSHSTVYLSTYNQAGIYTFTTDGHPELTYNVGEVDGIGIDAKDTVYAAQPGRAGPQITRLSTLGKVLGTIPTPLRTKIGSGQRPSGLTVGRDGTLLLYLDVDVGEGKSTTTTTFLQKRSASGRLLIEKHTTYGYMAFGPDGTIYSSSGYHLNAKLKVLQKWNPGLVCPGTEQDSTPAGIAIAPDGSLYAADTKWQIVEKRSPTGALLSLWGSCPLQSRPYGVAVMRNGTIIASGDRPSPKRENAFESTITLYSPRGAPAVSWVTGGWGDVALDAQGNIYVTQRSPALGVSRFSPSGKLLQSFLVPKESSPSEFRDVWGIAVDSHGNVYASENSPDRILKFSAHGKLLTTWGSEGDRPGQFSSPKGLAIDGRDNLYVADDDNNRVQKLSPAGKVLAQWSVTAVPNADLPYDVAVDGRGNVWVVCDGTRGGVIELSPAGKVLAAWPGEGIAPGQFYQPTSVAIDSSDHVYVADWSNWRIQEYTP